MNIIIKKVKEISEETKFTLAAVVIIVSAGSYITLLRAEVSNNSSETTQLRTEVSALKENQAEMRGDIKVIRFILEKGK